jgi:hypothetical protein
MKKIILAVAVFAAGYALSAQETVAYKVQSTSSSNIYSVPEPIRINFQTSNPNAVMATWVPMNEWWRASYKDENNRIIHVYYNTQPYYMEKGRDVNYTVALPVVNSYVPESVITEAVNRYGGNLYSITSLKATGNVPAYQVFILENGMARTELMNAENTAFVDVNKIKADDDQLKVKTDEK